MFVAGPVSGDDPAAGVELPAAADAPLLERDELDPGEVAGLVEAGAPLGLVAEVGGHVRRVGVAAMNAADAARRHEPDPGGAANRERAADGRRADRTLRDAHAEVAGADLACASQVGERTPRRLRV